MHLRLDCAGEHRGRSPDRAHGVYDRYQVEPCFTIPPYHHENPAEIAVKEVKKLDRVLRKQVGLKPLYWPLSTLHGGNVLRNIIGYPILGGGIPYTIVYHAYLTLISTCIIYLASRAMASFSLNSAILPS